MILRWNKVLFITHSFFHLNRTSSINRQSSTSSLSALDKTWYGEIQPTTSHSVTSAPAVAAAPLPSSLGHSSSSGSSVIAAAASQAIAATQQVHYTRLEINIMIIIILFRCNKEDAVQV